MAALAPITQQMFTCPACKKDVFATLHMQFTLGTAVMNGDASEVPATGKVTGVRITHDCVQKVTR